MGWLSDWSWPFGVVDEVERWWDRVSPVWAPRSAEPTQGALTHEFCAERFADLEGAWQEQFESLRRQLTDLEARLPGEDTTVEGAVARGRHGVAVQRVLARAQRTATTQGLVVAEPATPLRSRRRR